MGCDIHLHIEIKLDNKWEHYSTPKIDRNYALFEKMAGVRSSGSISPICNPKGLPKDATLLTLLDYSTFRGYGHSASWLDENEIMILEDYIKDVLGKDLEHNILNIYFFGNSFTSKFRFPEETYYKDIMDRISSVRFVFWFDN